MEAVISCIIHEEIALKLGKCPYMENRIYMKARELSLFTFRQPIAERIGKLIKTFFNWSIFKTWLWNKIRSIKACYRFLLSFSKLLKLEIISIKSGKAIIPRTQRELHGIQK